MKKIYAMAVLFLVCAQANASDPMIQVGDSAPGHVGVGLAAELPSSAVIEVTYSGFGSAETRYFSVSAQSSISASGALDVTITPITWSSEIAGGRAHRLASLGVVHAYRDTELGLDGTVTIVPITIGVTNEDDPNAKLFYRAAVDITGFQVMALKDSYQGFAPFEARVRGEIGMNTSLGAGRSLRFTFVGVDASLGFASSYGEAFSRVALMLDRLQAQIYIEGGVRGLDASGLDSSSQYTLSDTAYGYLRIGIAQTF